MIHWSDFFTLILPTCYAKLVKREYCGYNNMGSKFKQIVAALSRKLKNLGNLQI